MRERPPEHSPFLPDRLQHLQDGESRFLMRSLGSASVCAAGNTHLEQGETLGRTRPGLAFIISSILHQSFPFSSSSVDLPLTSASDPLQVFCSPGVWSQHFLPSVCSGSISIQKASPSGGSISAKPPRLMAAWRRGFQGRLRVHV